MAQESSKLPLGVRLSNPGNLEWGSPWEGLVPQAESMYAKTGTAPQKRFAQFTDAAFGIRAIARTLITYYDKRKAADGSKIDSIAEVIARWAPSHENNTSAYAKHVASLMGVNPDAMINVKDYDTMRGLVVGIIAHENAGYAYPDAVIDEGLRRAGLVKKTAAPAVPVNTATVAGAAAPAAVGLTQLAPIIPDIMQSITGQQENLTSGDWTRALVGVVLIGLGGVVAWSQYQKRKAGAV